MDEILLHQYATSPFSEKVRLALGRKGLAWRAVEQPTILPKPHLVPLTGGYRRIPVMQIGADVYCDSQCILRELERRHPEPRLVPPGEEASHHAFAFWADRVLFQTAVGVVFGLLGDAVPQAFLDDRSQLMGRRFDVAELEAAVPMLRDGRRFLLGSEPGLADLSTYHPLWFLERFPLPAAEGVALPSEVEAWAARVAAIGHGEPKPMEPAEALERARTTRPDTTRSPDAGDPNGRRPGDRVAVLPDDYGRDPVVGEIVAHSAQEISIRREDPAVGEVVVHFPRAGFLVVPAGAAAIPGETKPSAGK